MNKLISILTLLILSSCATKNVISYKKYSKENPLNIDTAINNALITNDTFEGEFKVEPMIRDSGSKSAFQAQRVTLKPFTVIKNKKEVGNFLSVHVFSSGWVFMNSVSIKCGDKKIKINFKENQVLRKIILSPHTTEDYFHKLSSSESKFLSTCNSGDTYRLHGGKGYVESKISPEERQYIQENEVVSKYIGEIKAEGFINKFSGRAKKN